jgi:hypothetical protein
VLRGRLGKQALKIRHTTPHKICFGRFAMVEPGFFCIGYVPDPFSIGKSRKSLIADEATTPAPKLYLASWRDGCSVCIQPSGPR